MSDAAASAAAADRATGPLIVAHAAFPRVSTTSTAKSRCCRTLFRWCGRAS